MALICLSYVNPAATQHAHRLTRRLRQHFGPEVRIMVGLWTARPAAEAREELLQAIGADLLATSLGQAVRQIAEGASRHSPSRGAVGGMRLSAAGAPCDRCWRAPAAMPQLSRRPAAARPRPDPRAGWC